ncbi:hypothetical protein [Streptomyces virginiae]|uniref:hypothetical protein n=1 Tax=Streptomyces virginiae TaxID=1961 RepID=UPI003667EBDC
MSAGDPFRPLMVIAETRISGQVCASRVEVDRGRWQAHPELRKLHIDRVLHQLLRHLDRAREELDVRLFLWDGERETPLREDQLSASADPRR